MRRLDGPEYGLDLLTELNSTAGTWRRRKGNYIFSSIFTSLLISLYLSEDNYQHAAGTHRAPWPRRWRVVSTAVDRCDYGHLSRGDRLGS